ncbi:hypothetical protein JIX58_10410 [Brevundimonas diminuta]|uniref:hypothetical protein n=1 Tax=Brevundimonas TaxID=41275 RepID=UPI0019070361|nr:MULTISPECIES: hypothetical protein [Brevundimonas]MBK1976156.1 hypothetical protein [Brevundimonas diminuta]
MNSAAVNRAYMARTGLTYSGQRLWTIEEIAILRNLHPDYGALVRALPGRTLAAIQNKAQRFGLVRPRRIWSEAEFAAIKPLYVRGAPMPEILDRLESKTKRQVWTKAANRGIRRPRRAPCLTGFAVLDSVRRRAFDLRLSMADLDDLAGRKSYFKRPRRMDWSAVQRVLPHLGGQVEVFWHGG